MTSILKRDPAARPSQRAAGASHSRVTSRFAPVGYLTAALFFLVPLLDIATLGLPFQPGDTAWRFGVLGAASNYLLTCFFGVVLGCWTAAYYLHGRTLRVLGVLAVLSGVVLLVLVGDFLLNIVQLRSSVPQTDMQAFLVGSGKATIKYAMLSLGAIVVGIVSWRAAGAGRRH